MTTALATQQNGGNVAQSKETDRSWASVPVDVYESANEYLVFADIPGVTKDDINIEFSGGELRLQASRHSKENDSATDYRRAFTVGSDVDVDKISAELSNGVLQVHLPKLEAAKPRQITIHAA